MASDPTRVALVTGAARGIGRAIALRLAEQGRTIVVADLLEEQGADTANEIKRSGANAVSVRMDVTDTASVRAAVEKATALVGPIDILVNNAGWDEHIAFVDTTEAFWLKVIQINYVGALRTTQAVVPGMAERGWGRVVSIGSDA